MLKKNKVTHTVAIYSLSVMYECTPRSLYKDILQFYILSISLLRIFLFYETPYSIPGNSCE